MLRWHCPPLVDGDGRRPRAMEVHVLPLAVPAVPHACLFRLHGLWHPAAVHVLREPDVRNAGSIITHQVDVGIQDDGVDRLAALGQSIFKVESVKVHPFH